ncbi:MULTISPECIES: hypothetical protein [unclassified Mycolicibacterium]|uniref:hypothetical protein n=1 Tax=unclassified Mycolicibacterium TaxID=2636767 RepID=UPI001F4C1F8E|nr:hypothetical protein [Mycolicibacterium sp. YH-1]UNB55336.1 hypothetical protein L0M16_14030 [Mycolicibacterium sp. YH-1]HET7741832.1 hypothetical protein [Mycobacterium sp.]
MTAPIQLPPQVHIAGVAWPMYKLVALAVGAVVLALVGLVTMSLGPAVIAASATGTAIWLAMGLLQHSED